MTSFGLIGAAGYIAPRHMRAIRETGNNLVFVIDPSDSLGVLDQYFPEAEFFSMTDDRRPTTDGTPGSSTIRHPSSVIRHLSSVIRHPSSVIRHLPSVIRPPSSVIRPLSSVIRHPSSVDYISICSPNYLHEEHIRWALDRGASVICEKPLVTDLRHLDIIEKMEQSSGRTVSTIMQLRLHPVVEEIRRMTDDGRPPSVVRHRSSVKLEYITARGRWYLNSWKGLEEKSGGIAMNIGIHLFDLMTYLFGPMKESEVITYQPDKARGLLTLEHADVEWFLSIDENDLPSDIRSKGHRAFRNITLNGQSVEFTEGFTDLHTESYRQILDGKGYGIADVRESLRIVEEIRKAGK